MQRVSEDSMFSTHESVHFSCRLKSSVTGLILSNFFFFQINGFSLDRVTHNEAVQHFVNAGETVTLKVIQGAEDAILVSM